MEIKIDKRKLDEKRSENMGRKAKDAAQKKIGEWTGSRRNVSKTTTKNENTNASNENRTPLQTQSQSDINAMKNCSVRLEIMRSETKTNEIVSKTPANDIPADDVIIKDKQADAKNVYDYSFDADDIPGPMQKTEDEMKDLFEKLAKENIIEVKKYRPKNVKKKKTDEKVPAKKETTQKRRREKQPIDTEPPQKKPNLKSRVAKSNAQKVGTTSATTAAVPPKRHIDAENLANNNVPTKKVTFESKQTVNANVVIRSSARQQANTVNIENVNIQPRLRSRVIDNFQSTPKQSTPLGTNATIQSKENNRSLFFDNASPLVGSTRATRGQIKKNRLQLSAINDSQEDVPTPTITKPDQNQENDNAPQMDNFDDDDFDFGNNMANEPQPDLDVDKENSLDRPSTSAAALSAQNRSATSSAALSSWDQPSTSAAALRSLNRPGTSATTSNVQKKVGTVLLRNQPSTSKAAQIPRKTNDNSIFDIQDTSEPNFFSPTKRVQRVYGRSPLKNIVSFFLFNCFTHFKIFTMFFSVFQTSEVNNTNSPSFESIKSMPRSFGVLQKSTTNSIQTVNSTKDTNLTLPEASYFSSRREAQDFDRHIDDQNFVDNCFGFDDGDDDDEITDVTANKESEHAQTVDNDVSKSETEKLKEIRARLKRFLHNPDAEPNESIKMSKVTNTETTTDKAKKGRTPKKTPIKSPTKTIKSPAKPKRNIVFGDTGAKQKDIRNAFTAKTTDKHSKSDKSKDGPAAVLFQEVDTVCFMYLNLI